MDIPSVTVKVTAPKKIKFSWITLPPLSTKHKVAHAGILSFHIGYFEPVPSLLLDSAESESERLLGQIKSSSTTCIKNGMVFHTP